MAAPGDPPAADAAAQGLPQRAPDFIEQDSPDTIDNIVPTRGYEMLPMVGLGGSAGSIAALQEFFRAMPTDSGMVFVVILHLSPESRVDPARAARPLDRDAGAQGRGRRQGRAQPRLRHSAGQGSGDRRRPSAPAPISSVERGRRVAVDLFFRSLADTHGPHAAAIVLSGADGDGAIGIKRIKERGGLTIAQDPDEAEHRRHAARRHRHRHGRLGAAGRRDAGAPARLRPSIERKLDACRPRTGRSRPSPAPATDEARGGAARGAGLPAHAHRPRLLVLQAGDHPAPHRPPHAGQRRRATCRPTCRSCAPTRARPARCSRTC